MTVTVQIIDLLSFLTGHMISVLILFLDWCL